MGATVCQVHGQQKVPAERRKALRCGFLVVGIARSKSVDGERRKFFCSRQAYCRFSHSIWQRNQRQICCERDVEVPVQQHRRRFQVIERINKSNSARETFERGAISSHQAQPRLAVRAVIAQTPKQTMKIGIVGSGIAGLAAASLLSKDHEVVLFEAEATLGSVVTISTSSSWLWLHFCWRCGDKKTTLNFCCFSVVCLCAIDSVHACLCVTRLW